MPIADWAVKDFEEDLKCGWCKNLSKQGKHVDFSKYSERRLKLIKQQGIDVSKGTVWRCKVCCDRIIGERAVAMSNYRKKEKRPNDGETW